MGVGMRQWRGWGIEEGREVFTRHCQAARQSDWGMPGIEELNRSVMMPGWEPGGGESRFTVTLIIFNNMER